MDVLRLFLLFSASSIRMLAPFVANVALHSAKLRYAFFYLSVCALSFCLWARSRYESLSGQACGQARRSGEAAEEAWVSG
jgi:hypothetical protein